MFPTTWEGVFQAIVLILFVAWGIAMLIPAMRYLVDRADSRAKVASDRDRNIINGTTNRAVVPVAPDYSDEG